MGSYDGTATPEWGAKTADEEISIATTAGDTLTIPAGARAFSISSDTAGLELGPTAGRGVRLGADAPLTFRVAGAPTITLRNETAGTIVVNVVYFFDEVSL